MKAQRIAVTGGTGRIGREVVKQLLERGHTVFNLDRRQGNDALGKFVCVDLRHREILQPIFEQCDAVCHLGEIPHLGTHPPEEVYAHNCAVGSAVMQTVADLKLPRLIYTSSSQAYGVYGEPAIAPAILPFDETLPLRPQNAYGLSKACNERYAEMLSRHQGLSIAIFRFPGVYTWRMGETDDWHWLETKTGPVAELSTYVSVEDAARAYVLAVENPRPGCEAYHFSAAEVASALPLRERLEKYHPDYPSLPTDWPLYKSPMLNDKARNHFGWEPSYNVLDIYRKQFGCEPHERVKSS